MTPEELGNAEALGALMAHRQATRALTELALRQALSLAPTPAAHPDPLAPIWKALRASLTHAALPEWPPELQRAVNQACNAELIEMERAASTMLEALLRNAGKSP